MSGGFDSSEMGFCNRGGLKVRTDELSGFHRFALRAACERKEMRGGIRKKEDEGW